MEEARKGSEAKPIQQPPRPPTPMRWFDLLNLEEEREVASAKKERTRDPTSRAGRQPAAAATSSSRRPVQQLGDVMTIEN